MREVFTRFCDGLKMVTILLSFQPHSCFFLSVSVGGGPDEERWSRVHVECSSWLHPHLSLQPGHRAESWSPHHNPSPQQSRVHSKPQLLTCSLPNHHTHQHPRFGEVLKKLRLQKRGTGGVDTAAKGSTYDISNIDRLGKSEVSPFNLLLFTECTILQNVRWSLCRQWLMG